MAEITYDIWDGATREQIGARLDKGRATILLANYGLRGDKCLDLLTRAGQPGDMAIEMYGFVVMAK